MVCRSSNLSTRAPRACSMRLYRSTDMRYTRTAETQFWVACSNLSVFGAIRDQPITPSPRAHIDARARSADFALRDQALQEVVQDFCLALRHLGSLPVAWGTSYDRGGPEQTPERRRPLLQRV